MKRISILIIMIVMLTTLAGCKKKNIVIKPSEIENNTMLVKEDGTIQVATIEEFNKDYYNLDELKSFIDSNITEFNQNVGDENAIKLNSLDKKKDQVIMVLEYANMNYYAEFNQTEAAMISGSDSTEIASMTTSFYVGNEESKIQSTELTLDENARVIVLNEEYELIVNNKIEYYSAGNLLDEQKIHTIPDGSTVIIYYGDSK